MSYVVLASLSCRSMPKHTWDENRNSHHNQPALSRCTRNKIDAHRRTILAWRRVIRSLCHCHSMRPSNQIYLSNQSTYSSIYSSLLFFPVIPLDARIKCSLLSDNGVHEQSENNIICKKLSSHVHCRLSSTSFPPPRCPTQRVTQISSWSTFKWRRRKRRKESGEKLLKCFRTTSKLCSEKRLDSRVEWAEQQRQLDETMVPMNSAAVALLLLAFQVCRLETRSTGWGATARVESKRVWEVEGNL